MTGSPDSRPRTLWFGNYTSITPGVISSVTARVSPDSAARPDIAKSPKPNSVQNDSRNPHPRFHCRDKDPWSEYEPRAHIFRGRQVTLAHHRINRQDIVNVQCLRMDRSKVPYLLETVDQLSHDSFPRLLGSYYKENQLFLVWEPLELSVEDIISAKWPTNQAELARIVGSVLEGIRFLRDKGRALATLGPETILLNENGGVRVAGVEHSCQLHPSEMNAHTLKLTALAAVMSSLMAKSPGKGGWSREAQDFLQNLAVKPLDRLMHEPFLTEVAGEGDLKLCAHITNKIADHDLKLYHLTGISEDLGR